MHPATACVYNRDQRHPHAPLHAVALCTLTEPSKQSWPYWNMTRVWKKTVITSAVEKGRGSLCVTSKKQLFPNQMEGIINPKKDTCDRSSSK